MLDDPENFKSKEMSKLGVLDTILQPEVYPELYGNIDHVVRINYYPPRGDNKEGWDNIDIFGWMGYPMQIKIDFLCRDSILAAPHRARPRPVLRPRGPAPGSRACRSGSASTSRRPSRPAAPTPEHDIFIQQTKLKNTLREWMGEAPVTHSEAG